MKNRLFVFGSLISIGILAAAGVNASYISDCNKLITKWNQCQEKGGGCQAETKAIEQQCKCHVLKGKDWKLVQSAVGDDNVCGKPPEEFIIPPPPPPPTKHYKQKEQPGKGDQ